MSFFLQNILFIDEGSEPNVTRKISKLLKEITTVF